LFSDLTATDHVTYVGTAQAIGQRLPWHTMTSVCTERRLDHVSSNNRQINFSHVILFDTTADKSMQMADLAMVNKLAFLPVFAS
jgi:hypothetical protein